MRARRTWPIITLSAALLAPACLLTTSLDGFSGGAQPDGGSPEPDAGDAAVDAAVSDARGADVVDAARPFRCADQVGAVFCADFEADPFDGDFSETLTSSGGTLAVGAGRFGRGFVAQVPQRSTETRPSAARVRRLATVSASASFTYAYDILIESPIGVGVLDYGGFYYNGAFYTLSLRSLTDGSFYLHEYADPSDAGPELNRSLPLAHGPTPGVWSHVVIKVTFGANGSAVTLTVNGDVLMDGVAVDAYLYATTPKIAVGIQNNEGTGNAAKMTYDDVLVTMP